MSEMIVIGYDSHSVAKKAFKAVQELQKDSVVDLTGLAVVSVDQDGETHVDTPGKSEKVAKAATAGALWAMVLGIVILTPAMGVVGAAAGGLIGKLSQMGIDEKFRGKVHALLQPGSAAVVIMATNITDDTFGTAMQQFGGTVLKTSLAEQAEKEFAEQLAGTS
ncbi:DUF1269 domain-containing protein [Streptomyces sp. NPDC020681]|uniref:DUF1269 domain-containing protein n=1 Tax=Streptomyces sp. NPDC020681 TaxID=3365083 RepID=UPI00378D20CF